MKKKTIRMFCACEEDGYKPTLFAADCKVTPEMVKDAILNYDCAFGEDEDFDENITRLMEKEIVKIRDVEFFFEVVDFYYED